MKKLLTLAAIALSTTPLSAQSAQGTSAWNWYYQDALGATVEVIVSWYHYVSAATSTFFSLPYTSSW